MKTEPTIQKFMTCNPHSIAHDRPVREAFQVMKDKGIRHLPVTKDGKLAGIVSDRGLKAALAFRSIEVDTTKVEDVCRTDVYTAHPESLLGEVAKEMAEHHFGCAVVEQNGKIVGIFTTVDACRALDWVLSQRYHPR